MNISGDAASALSNLTVMLEGLIEPITSLVFTLFILWFAFKVFHQVFRFGAIGINGHRKW